MKTLLLNRAAGGSLFATLLTLVERLAYAPPHRLRVLTYHRVDVPGSRPWLNPSLLSATPECFDEQMRFIARSYHPVSARQVLDYYTRGTCLPRRAVLVTFDDAYEDFAEHAWPVLQKYQVPAVLFVPTGYPDHPERCLWWDQLYAAIGQTQRDMMVIPEGSLALKTPADRQWAYRRVREYVKRLPHRSVKAWVDGVCQQLEVEPPANNFIMHWDDLRRLAAEGLTLAPHTRSHPMMNRVSLDEAREEALQSREDLEREIGSVLPLFAYPSGGFTNEVSRMLEQVGFQAAFTTERGVNALKKADRMQLQRINVSSRLPFAAVRTQMLSPTIPLLAW